MRKKNEVNLPNTCINKAHDEELVFVLLGRDAAAPITIRAWVAERLRLGKNIATDEQIVEALEYAATMESEGRKWADAIGCGAFIQGLIPSTCALPKGMTANASGPARMACTRDWGGNRISFTMNYTWLIALGAFLVVTAPVVIFGAHREGKRRRGQARERPAPCPSTPEINK